VFDILEVDGRDITRWPYSARGSLLSEIASSTTGFPVVGQTPIAAVVGTTGAVVQLPPNWTDVDPAVVLAASAEMGLEGIVCKHLDATYTSGLRSRDWIRGAPLA
jgi:bifunctional non-homologous end joining protein LigD